MPARSNSSRAGIALPDRCRYYWQLFNLHRHDTALTDISDLAEEFRQVDGWTRRCCGKSLDNVKVLEIGFGARPYRLAYFSSRGVDVVGIDIDQPILTGSASEALRIALRNGPLRATKSVARYWLFDRKARKSKSSPLALMRALEPGRLIIGNAGAPEPWARIGRPHVIYSFRVFEHIDVTSLRQMLELMHRHLQPNGLCYIVVTVYTGIIGNHLPEWYPDRLHMPCKQSEPWEHLRRRRFRADTYLNKLTRRQYLELFSTRFAVLKDEPMFPGLGREFLTDQVRQELSEFDEYELLSNDVLFLLRPLGTGQSDQL